jgi:hypothetical protein
MPNHFFDLIGLRTFRVSVGCLLAMTMSGCAVIDQIHGDGTITRAFAFGAPVMMPTDPSGQANVTKVNGLGFIVSNSATTLGWFDETVAALGPDCRVVLIGNTEEELQRFAALLPGNTEVCSDAIPNGGQK